MNVRLGRTTWEIRHSISKPTELEENSLRVKTPAVVETRVLKYKSCWYGIRRKFLREFDSYESFHEDLNTELDGWAKRKYA